MLLAIVSALGGCNVSPPPNVRPETENSVSLSPDSWYIFYSEGMPPHPSGDKEGAWSFELPEPGHVNYVQTPFSVTEAPHDVVVSFRVASTAPQYGVLDPGDFLPATVHIFLEQQGDDLAEPNGRWWAQTGVYNLGSNDNVTCTLDVPFTPDQWSNVYGQFDAGGFSKALSNVGWIGLTFGGQYFGGHGVTLSAGQSKFILIDFRVI